MNRELILDEWLEKILQGKSFKRESLIGDASGRKYYRLYISNSENLIVMDAPHPENPMLFKELADYLQTQHLSVPKVFASHPLGFLLLSDLGDRLYLNELNHKTAPKLYEDALNALVKFNQCKKEVPCFDRPFLQRQMNIFKDWFLVRHLKIEFNSKLDSLLQCMLELLEKEIMAQPFVFVHRDYHSRNLMCIEINNPGILDFQDAMMGPIAYDVVSLLQDCYIVWPRDKVELWASQFKNYAQSEALINNRISTEQFLRWVDLTGVQRHLKNLGIFSRLNYRDGKPNYMKDLQTPLHYTLEAIERYKELSPLKEYLYRALDKNQEGFPQQKNQSQSMHNKTQGEIN